MKLNMKIFYGVKKPEFYKNILIKADKDLHAQIADEIKKLHIPKNSKILDFGCGEGALSERLKDMGYDVTSVDIDQENFKASTPFIKLDFNSDKDIHSFVNENLNKFDLVLSIEVIEHVHNHYEHIKTLKELVKPGGYIIISTPNVTSWLSRLYFLLFGRFNQFMEDDLTYGHINPISFWQIKHIFRNLNIEFISMREAGTLPQFYFPNFKIKTIIANLFSLLMSPIMKELGGPKYGWSIIVVGRKNV